MLVKFRISDEPSSLIITISERSIAHYAVYGMTSTDYLYGSPSYSGFSICAKYYANIPTDTTQFNTILSTADSGASGHRFLIDTRKPGQGGDVRVAYIGSSYSINPAEYDGWHSLCVSLTSPDGLEIWYDGVTSVTATKTWSICCNGILVLGQDQDVVGGNFNALQTLVGQITKVNVWTRGLATEEMVMWTNGSRYFEGDLVAWSTTKARLIGDVSVLEEV